MIMKIGEHQYFCTHCQMTWIDEIEHKCKKVRCSTNRLNLQAKLISIMLSILIGALGAVITMNYGLGWVIGFAIIFGMGINEFMNFLKYWEEVI